MAGRTILYQWLEGWEQALEGAAPADLDAFVERHCQGGDPGLVAEFRRMAGVLRAMKPLLGALGAPAGNTAGSPEGTDGRTELCPALQPGLEIIPGYPLERRLGKGGFGEVWQARSPAGGSVALKFVPLEQPAAWREKRGLEVVSRSRHPNLLAMLGSWQVGGVLVIAMELADRTLAERLREAQSKGQAGIPREELLRYFDQAADALDYLNRPHRGPDGEELPGNQHRDIKPQNLLLVGDTLKVGDFGLARCLEGTVASHTGCLTPAYAAPEFFDDKVTRQSDQYSLAVTWCVLRGGRLPFEGSNEKVMAGHLHGEPDLTMLPETERAAVRRALAKQPRERWPCCKDFVTALRACADLEGLRAQVRADPLNAPLRRLYLALRTPELKERDRRSAGLRVRWQLTDALLVLVLGALFYRGPYLPEGAAATAYWLWWAVLLMIAFALLVGKLVTTWRLRERLRAVLAELGPLGRSLHPALLDLPPHQLRRIYLTDVESPP